MIENLLTPTKGCNRKKRRLGCGPGSKLGSTCGRGHDGQRSRSGKRKPYVGFEGGQMPLFRRVPKRGFNHSKPRELILNLSDLEKLSSSGEITFSLLREKKLLRKNIASVVVLSKGDLKSKILVQVNRISASAKQKIESLGGNVSILDTLS